MFEELYAVCEATGGPILEQAQEIDRCQHDLHALPLRPAERQSLKRLPALHGKLHNSPRPIVGAARRANCCSPRLHGD